MSIGAVSFKEENGIEIVIYPQGDWDNIDFDSFTPEEGTSMVAYGCKGGSRKYQMPMLDISTSINGERILRLRETASYTCRRLNALKEATTICEELFFPNESNNKYLRVVHNDQVSSNVRSFITEFEDTLTSDELGNTHYAYRVVFTRVDGKRKNSYTDEVISFLSADDPMAQNIKAKYAVIKETEKKKYLSNEIIQIMKEEGYEWLSINVMTSFWKNELGSRENYGVYVTKTQWMWYENWIPIIRDYCKEEDERRKKIDNTTFKPGQIVKIIQEKGYHAFSIYWLNTIVDLSGINREDEQYATKDKYGHTLWKDTIIPIMEKYCEEHKTKFMYYR